MRALDSSKNDSRSGARAPSSISVGESSRAAGRTIRDPVLRRWVDLHAEPDFLAQADWLRRQVDAADPALEPALSAAFGRALALEIDFHSAPYDREARR